MQPQPQAPPSPMNLEQMHETARNIVHNLCSIVSMPVEMILRPQYGTRYFPITVVFFSAMLMMLLPLLSATATGIVNMIPFSHASMPVGLFSIGSLSSLYFFLSILHGIRQYRLMICMELEKNSEFEGPPLPIFRLIPGSGSFWFTRIVLEPVFVFVAASLLEHSFIIQSGLSAYLHLAALMLALKSFIAWHKAWEYVRKLLDLQYVGPIIAKLVQNKATPEELASAHLASFPKNISPEMRQATGIYIARAHGTEINPLSNENSAN